ncbi:DUF2634 domain-containing protein [Ligilactobacillus equi]|uniref:Uncharacterized protein n=1 Tax=Ligilactobacillus equi DSM 15833 = JCM 10991 TaxID=1423740 RepID=A0A0R1TKP2_9LACO|nr:DUF2634 domain-containing protein [Ligilactobacillus equi]KRL81815.1 hypothetical protein FC36_GL001410 [Ligilactobacillus equi DSM 15833 = JCM 10991]
MKDIKLNSDGDFTFADNDIQVVSDLEEIEQTVSLVVKTRKGEFFADENLGMDQSFLTEKGATDTYIASCITDALSQEERVINANVTKIERNNRDLTIAFTVNLNDGQMIESEVSV